MFGSQGIRGEGEFGVERCCLSSLTPSACPISILTGPLRGADSHRAFDGRPGDPTAASTTSASEFYDKFYGVSWPLSRIFHQEDQVPAHASSLVC